MSPLDIFAFGLRLQSGACGYLVHLAGRWIQTYLKLAA
jgi:hypothetical protein